MSELEAQAGQQPPSDMIKEELSQSLVELEALLKEKDEVRTQGDTAACQGDGSQEQLPYYSNFSEVRLVTRQEFKAAGVEWLIHYLES